MRIWTTTLACTLAASLVACETTSTDRAAEAGAVHMALDVAGGATLNVVSYAIDGPGSFMKMGTIDVSTSATITAQIAPLPPGTNYSIVLSAMSNDASAMCMGSAPFDVVAHQTTSVLVHMLCKQPSPNGSVAFKGPVNICPLIDNVSASPSEVLVGGSIALTTQSHDTDNSPGPLAYHWTATSGTLSDAAVASPTFTCTSPGAVTLTLTLTDGDASCVDTQSLTVQCTGS
jgi:hypothetical protein